jgi:hypothetical protein
VDNQILLTLVTSVISSGITGVIVAALLRRLFDSQIEIQKAYLARQSKVHEQQVNALRVIHASLKRANYFFQRLSSRMKLANENDEDLYKQFNKHMVAASDLYLDNELLIPESLTAQLDTFFGKTKSAEVDLSFAMSRDFPNGEDRAKLWDKAGSAAFQELPAILKAIAAEARSIIHILTD